MIGVKSDKPITVDQIPVLSSQKCPTGINNIISNLYLFVLMLFSSNIQDDKQGIIYGISGATQHYYHILKWSHYSVKSYYTRFKSSALFYKCKLLANLELASDERSTIEYSSTTQNFCVADDESGIEYFFASDARYNFICWNAVSCFFPSLTIVLKRFSRRS